MRLRRTPRPDPSLLLLRSVCHELRPPVATLTSLVRALEAQPSEIRRGELARLAGEHASHAEAVLKQAAAAAAGLAEPADTAVPLDRVLPVVAATVPADRLAVSVSAGAGRCLVSGRHTRQILLNLLSNAARYSPGEIRLTAAIRRRRLRLTVADQGGLTDDLRHALHRRVPPAGTKGLGLWVVRHLVDAQRGSLRARALSPRGVALEVTLPRRRR
jgi:signal transduction histidine kinase